MSSCATGLIVLATILGPITLVFMSVSFGTDHWLKFHVDRDELSDSDKAKKHDYYSHTRYRGLFRECYPGNDTAFLEENDDVVDDYCLPVKYEMPDNTSDKSDEYFVRIHLLRLFLAFFIMALVFFVGAFVLGLILCCWRVSRWAYLAGLFAYISAFSLAAAIAFFHGAEYLERNKIDNACVDNECFYMQWPEGIQKATTRSYEWSYALGWVGMILATLSATFYSVAGCLISAARYEDRERLEKDPYRGGRDYPMYAVDDPYVIKPQPVYAADYPRAYNGPYMMATPETARYVIAEPAPREMWSMREVSN